MKAKSASPLLLGRTKHKPRVAALFLHRVRQQAKFDIFPSFVAGLAEAANIRTVAAPH